MSTVLNPPAQKESPSPAATSKGAVIGPHASNITQRSEFASLFAAVARSFASISRLFLLADPARIALFAVVAGGAA